MDELLAELDRRLSALRCLPPPTRRLVTDWALAQTEPEMVRGYLSRFLGTVEGLAAQCGPAFQRLCDELIDEDSERRVQARFGYRGGNYKDGWIEVETHQTSIAEQMYCTMNVLALILPSTPEEMAERTAGSLFLRLLQHSSSTPAAELIRWAEDELKITRESYSNPRELNEAVRGILPLHSAVAGLRFLRLMGQGLNRLRRSGDAAALLSAVFWSETEGPAGAETIGARVHRTREQMEGLFPPEPVGELTPEEAAAYPTARSLHVRSVALGLAYFLETLAEADCRTGRAGRALAAVSALLGLWPESGADLTGPGRLRRLITDDAFRELVRRWCFAVHGAGRLAEAAEAFRQLFLGPDPGVVHEVWSDPECASAAAVVLDTLAGAVGEVDGHAAAFELLSTALALSVSDLDDPDRLGALFAERFAHLDGPTLLRLAGNIMLQLWLGGRPLDALGAMEMALVLDTSAYDSSDTVRARLAPFWSGDVPAPGELDVLLKLVILLHLSGRGRHALRLILALNPELCRSWDIGSYDRLRTWLGDFSANHIDEFVARLGLLWQNLAPGAAIDLLSSHLGLSPEIVADPARMRATLHQRRGPRGPWTLSLSGLLWAMIRVAEWSDDPPAMMRTVAAVGEAALGIGSDWYESDSALAPPAGWDSSDLPWESAVIELAHPVASALIESGRVEEAVTFLDRAVECVQGTSIRDPEFVLRLTSEDPTAGPIGQRFLLLPPLISALDRSGREDELYALARGLVESLEWFQPDKGVSTGVNWLVVDTLLPVLGRHDPGAALRLARAFVPAFRTYGLRGDVTGVDRVHLIQFTQDARHHLIQTGYDAVAADPTGGAELRLEALCWDAELGQLMLRERYDRQPPRPEVEPLALPRALPFEQADDTPRLAEAAVALSGAAPAPSCPPSIRLDGPGYAPEEVGITPEGLAGALDTGERLLRIGFTTDGRLMWTLFAGTEDRQSLQILGDERAGRKPAPPTAPRVAGAVREYDRAVEAAQTAFSARTAAAEERFARAPGHPAEEPHRAREEELRRAAEEHHLARTAALERFLAAPVDARALVVEAVRAHDSAIAAAWAEYGTRQRAMREQFDRTRKRLLPKLAEKLQGQLNQELQRATEDLRAALDAATHRFLGAVSEALALDALGELLAAEDDLVVQVDDILHAVPFGFLTVAGRYLFERVRSVRVVLSLSVDSELRSLDRREANPGWFTGTPDRAPPDEVPPRVVGLSWFDPADPATPSVRPWERRFHRELSAIAAAPGHALEYRAAGQQPEGSHAALTADLAQGGSVRVLAVLGHGHRELAGVGLADGFWTGAELLRLQEDSLPGCDLSAVEFLIQASCSVGRVVQTGARDVDGFCANLVVGRVRSAVAGLWDLFTEDAVALAVDLARRYLEARTKIDEELRLWGFASFDEHRPRARALAALRRAWRAANPGPVPRCLNTVAAFELYGRG